MTAYASRIALALSAADPDDWGDATPDEADGYDVALCDLPAGPALELSAARPASRVLLSLNCGIGSTGFLPGNTCAKGGYGRENGLRVSRVTRGNIRAAGAQKGREFTDKAGRRVTEHTTNDGRVFHEVVHASGRKSFHSVQGPAKAKPAAAKVEATATAKKPHEMTADEHLASRQALADRVAKATGRPAVKADPQQAATEHRRAVAEAAQAGEKLSPAVLDSLPKDLVDNLEARTGAVPKGYVHPSEQGKAAGGLGTPKPGPVVLSDAERQQMRGPSRESKPTLSSAETSQQMRDAVAAGKPTAELVDTARDLLSRQGSDVAKPGGGPGALPVLNALPSDAIRQIAEDDSFSKSDRGQASDVLSKREAAAAAAPAAKATAPAGDAKAAVLAAAKGLAAKHPGGLVPLKDLRPALEAKGMSRADVDKALLNLESDGAATLVKSNRSPHELRAAGYEGAAVKTASGNDRHYVSVNPAAAPAAEATPPAGGGAFPRYRTPEGHMVQVGASGRIVGGDAKAVGLMGKRPEDVGAVPEAEYHATKAAGPAGSAKDAVMAAALKLGGGKHTERVRIADVRAELGNKFSREQVDKALLDHAVAGNAVLVHMDDPREKTAADKAAVFNTPGGEERHLMYVTAKGAGQATGPALRPGDKGFRPTPAQQQAAAASAVPRPPAKSAAGKAAERMGEKAPAAGSNVGGLSQKVKAGYKGPETVASGERPAGFTDNPAEAAKAKAMGLTVVRAGQFDVYAKDATAAGPLADHLKKNGYGRTPEQRSDTSRLAGYSPQQIADFRALTDAPAAQAEARNAGPASGTTGGMSEPAHPPHLSNEVMKIGPVVYNQPAAKGRPVADSGAVDVPGGTGRAFILRDSTKPDMVRSEGATPEQQKRAEDVSYHVVLRSKTPASNQWQDRIAAKGTSYEEAKKVYAAAVEHLKKNAVRK